MAASLSKSRASIAVAVLLLVTLAIVGASAAQESGSPTVVVVRPLLLPAPGVSSELLVDEEVGILPDGPSSLVLDQITLPPEATLPSHHAAGPEQILVVSGDVLILDEFGFSAPLTVDEGTTVQAKAAYELQNASESESIVLRLRVVSGASGADPQAGTPPAGSPSPPASPVLTDTIAVIELDGATPGPASLFMGHATWEPGAKSDRLDHTGPVGLYVTAGELSVTSPSGIEGRIGIGQAAAIPATTPLRAENSAGESTTAYVFGIHETGAAIFVLQVSLPAATPSLTPTPHVATATSTQPATPRATEPQAQTSTSEMTATSTPRVVTTPTAQSSAPEPSGEEEANPSPTQTTAIVAPLPTAHTRGEDKSEEIVESLSSTRTFAHSDWDSGWSQNDSSYYGRPWTVVYGAFSAHPRAILSFTLDGQPEGDAVLAVTGLDDEWEGSCVIDVLVNGTKIYSGPSPWQSYSGNTADFSDAEWTTSALAIPAGLLRSGSNSIVIENLEAAANFGSPPYILLSDTMLHFNTRS